MKNSLPSSFFKKPKIGRPSSTIKYVFYDYYEKLLDMLKSKKNNNEFFSNSEIFKFLIKDKVDNNFSRVNLYFKVLNYFIWKENFKI